MYTEYKVSLEYVLGSLGLRKMDEHIVRPQLGPALTAIMKYLASKLVSAEGYDIKDKIDIIRESYSRGADLVCAKQSDDLIKEVGYTGDPELFIFAWSNTLTTLYMKLLNQYSAILCESVINPGCPCECVGETWKDFEEYTSGIWPEDDEFSFTTTNDSTSTAGCGCAGKRMK